MEKLEKFRKLGLSENTLKALEQKGFEEPTPIQVQTIPILLLGQKDIVGQAQTGTGKTAAFGLPILEKIKENAGVVQVLILVPTRELAIQVSEELNSFKGSKRLQIIPVYGGQSIDLQLRKLKKGVDIVVGTPGRVLDHLNRKTVNLKNISYLVLDEADEMLNMGFIEAVEEILKSTNSVKRVLLFSATMPDAILRIAKKYMGSYELIAVKKEQLTASLTDQIYFEVSYSDKFEALCRIIDMEKEFYGLVFCRTKVDVDDVGRHLVDRGYDADALHGDMSQDQRERILNRFKNRKTNILVATDVAARGLDISNLTHVINYSLPQDPESYIHRIGRTGRAGKEGTAITFVTPEEYRSLMVIKRVAKTDIRKEKLPEIEDIINTKKSRIVGELFQIISKEGCEEYLPMAGEVLEGNDPEKVLAAMLKHFFGAELDERNYNQIRDVSVDNKGKTRLFVALGKSEGMSPKRLVDFINTQTRVHADAVRDIRIFDRFSFVSVPFKEAEIILDVFRKGKKGKRPIIVKAKAERQNN